MVTGGNIQRKRALPRGHSVGAKRAPAWIRAPSRRGAGHLPGGGPTGLPALWIPGKEYSPVAIYSLHVSNVSRAAGSSAVASCSYITSRRMRDERTGEAFNGFGRRERVEHVCTMLPEGAPASTSTRAFVQRRRDGRETFRREAREEDHGRPAPRVRRPPTLPRTGGLHLMEHHGQRLRLHVRHPHRQGRT